MFGSTGASVEAGVGDAVVGVAVLVGLAAVPHPASSNTSIPAPRVVIFPNTDREKLPDSLITIDSCLISLLALTFAP
jgi:hypothetical protein